MGKITRGIGRGIPLSRRGRIRRGFGGVPLGQGDRPLGWTKSIDELKFLKWEDMTEEEKLKYEEYMRQSSFPTKRYFLA